MMRPKCFDELWASICFFTRIPLYRFIPDIAPDSYRNVVAYWSLIGLLTGGSLALGFGLGWFLWGSWGAAIGAVVARLVLTGALHEDGLADCCDAFGGSHSREKTLAIMKDSHIGTYGVLGLISHFALLVCILSQYPQYISSHILLFLLLPFVDVASKTIVSLLHNLLPYARAESEAKVGFSFYPLSAKEMLITSLPFLLLLVGLLLCQVDLWKVIVPSIFIGGGVFLLSVRYLKVRIGGYTGDCYGGLFLLVELSIHLAMLPLATYLL